MSKIKNLMVRVCSNIEIRKENARKVNIRINNNRIVILDTAMNTDNIGDQIIMYFANKIIEPMLEGYDIYRIASHVYPSEDDIRVMMEAKYVIVCGTNILSPQMELYSGWKFDKRLIHLDNIVLMGVGWWGYKKPSLYSAYVYRKILSPKCYQSMRDSQAQRCLKELGINNTINTNCLTLWDLEEDCCNVPIEKSDTVIFTVTGVFNDIENDQKLISILKQNYEKIFFWPQGKGDREYYTRYLADDNIVVLGESLEAVTGFLKNTVTDYIGSRLHGGIYALHFERRVIVIAVDNRAIEIGKDTNLPVIKMTDISIQLPEMINSSWRTTLRLNKDEIKTWKESLRKALSD